MSPDVSSSSSLLLADPPCLSSAPSARPPTANSFVCVISNPVNSTVPIAAEVFKNAGTFDPKRLFGVTTLDVVRSSTMSAQAIDDPTGAPKYTIPVVGGALSTSSAFSLALEWKLMRCG